ncbi:MAG: hypothetical protein U5Q44_07415 [Dehalococcoidia bacterium]|nr:hypothetical protein [Dehalococcoidia bacterium]
MQWLKKLIGKGQTHEEWLEEHPGKESKSSPPPAINKEQEAKNRATMEAELDTAREKRDNEGPTES